MKTETYEVRQVSESYGVFGDGKLIVCGRTKENAEQMVAGMREAQDQRIAKARLVDAAPDLLAALQGVLRVADRKTDEFDAARAAIAKATGAVAP